jgi:hypothetical protein
MRVAVVPFPIGLTLGPPAGSQAPNGRGGRAEVAAAGVNLIRTGAGHQTLRPVTVENGSFQDWFALHDTHIYRFSTSA